MQKLNQAKIQQLLHNCTLQELNLLADQLAIHDTVKRTDAEELKAAILKKSLGLIRLAFMTLAQQPEARSFTHLVRKRYPERCMNVKMLPDVTCIGTPIQMAGGKSCLVEYCVSMTNDPDPLCIVIARNGRDFVIAILHADTFIHARRFSEIYSGQPSRGKQPLFDDAFIAHLAKYNLTSHNYSELVLHAIHLIEPETECTPAAIRAAFIRGANERRAVEDALRYKGSSRDIRCRG